MATPLCILLVDDSEFFLTLESKFLQHTPGTILKAKTADEALVLAAEQQPSLIFMDIDMPGTDGLTCCSKLKQEAGLRHIPIVLIGDQSDPESQGRATEAGADAYLAKPLDRRLFLEIGHSFLFSVDRREPRKPVHVSVDMTCMGETSQVSGIDVSTGGIFLSCQTRAAEGEHLLLKFTIPGSDGARTTLKGRVAWVNVAGKGRKPNYPDGYGVEFIDIPDDVGVALRRYIGQ